MAIKFVKANNFLYNKITIEEVISIRELENRTGIPASTWYNWAGSISTVPPEIFTLLYNLTKDKEFLNFFLKNTDQMLTPRQAVAEVGGIAREMIDPAIALGAALDEIKNSMMDGKLQPLEKQRIHKKLDNLQNEIEELRSCIQIGEM